MVILVILSVQNHAHPSGEILSATVFPFGITVGSDETVVPNTVFTLLLQCGFPTCFIFCPLGRRLAAENKSSYPLPDCFYLTPGEVCFKQFIIWVRVCVYVYVCIRCLFWKWRVAAGGRETEIIILCLKLQVDGNDPLGAENLVYEREENCWRNSLNRTRRWDLVLCLLAWTFLFPFS